MSLLFIKDYETASIKTSLVDFAHIYELGHGSGNPSGSNIDYNVLQGL